MQRVSPPPAKGGVVKAVVVVGAVGVEECSSFLIMSSPRWVRWGCNR